MPRERTIVSDEKQNPFCGFSEGEIAVLIKTAQDLSAQLPKIADAVQYLKDQIHELSIWRDQHIMETNKREIKYEKDWDAHKVETEKSTEDIREDLRDVKKWKRRVEAPFTIIGYLTAIGALVIMGIKFIEFVKGL